MCYEKSERNCLTSYLYSRVFLSLVQAVSIQYSSSSTNILYLNILYTNSECGKNVWTRPWTSGAIPRVSTRFSLSVENEQADTRRDGQIYLTKPNSQAQTGTRKFFPAQLSMARVGKLTRLICTQLFVMTTHAYIYTVGCTLNSRLLSGYLGFVAGTLRGSLFPVCYGSVGVQLT